MAQWDKPLLSGHNACWPDGLKTLTSLEGSFSTSIGLAGIELSERHCPLVSSLNCDWPLHSGLKAPELVMDAGCTDNSLLVHVTIGLKFSSAFPSQEVGGA